MASTDAGTELTEQHRRQVLALRAATLRELQELWPAWSVEDSGSFDPFARAATSVTMAGHTAAAQTARDYYQAFSVAETGEAATPAVVSPLERDRLFGWLRQQGLGSTVRALRAGKTMEQARQVGLVSVSGASGQMVTQGSYSTVIESAPQDPAVLGWARTTSGTPCAFCALLASRGPVYRSRSTADFQAHKSCACGAEPVYSRDAEWPGRGREFRRIYEEAVSDARNAGELRRGTDNDLLNAFRRRYSQLGGEDSIYAQNAARKRAVRAAEKAAREAAT